MSDIQLNISIKEENNILFKRCIRKLLDSTFIVGEKEEKLYSFISRESNRQDISDYLRMIGFDVLVDTNVRIAMLKPYEADEFGDEELEEEPDLDELKDLEESFEEGDEL